MTIQPIAEKPHPVGSGTQKIYRFGNNYGASVVRFEIMPGVGSYGADQGLWEMAVIEFDGATWDLVYDTPIADDVLGHLDDDEVEGVLAQIRDLPARQVTP